MTLLVKNIMMPMIDDSLLFIGSCRTGKSFRLEELASRSDEFIYILQPFHHIQNLVAKEFFRVNPPELFKNNAVFYSNSYDVLQEKFDSYQEIISFAIENNIKIFIDETDLVRDILNIIQEKKYSNIVCSLQSYSDYFTLDELMFFKNIFVGPINSNEDIKEIFTYFDIDITYEEYRSFERASYPFFKVK